MKYKQGDIWKTIKLGTHKTTKKLIQDIENKGMKISSLGKDIAYKIILSNKKETIKLVNISVEELGFKNGAAYGEIVGTAKDRGLELCPAEVGLQLRLQYSDQPKDEWFRIAMEAITGSDGGLDLFNIGHDGDDLWLNGSGGRADHVWHGSNRFVFCLRKS